MHDVHRDSLIADGKKSKIIKPGHDHSHDDDRGLTPGKENHDVLYHESHAHDMHDHSHGHTHDHEHEHDGHDHGHDHEVPHGHNHEHEEDAYEKHDRDLHGHEHDHEHREDEDRAFAHLHEHGHDFFHAHHHTHHPEHAGLVHKVFGDPLRDWFGAFLMGVLIAAGYFKWLPGKLSDGMLVCAAVIGIFPVLKNALFESIYKRTLRFELLIGILLLAGLFMGRFLVVALISLLLLIGSFLRLNFSWKD